MKGIGIFETLLSAAVIVLAGGFLGFTLWRTGTGSLKSYEFSARMVNADGLKPGTDVKIAGVKVGEVEDLALAHQGKRYSVDLKLAIRQDIAIPDDSRLSVGGGTLSSASLSITPGRSKTVVPPGGMLKAR